MNYSVTIKGQAFGLAPLNTGQIKKNWSKLAQVISAVSSAKGLDAFMQIGTLVEAMDEVVLASLLNSGAAVTMEDMDTLELDELQAAALAVIEVTGLGRKAQGEAMPPAPAEA